MEQTGMISITNRAMINRIMLRLYRLQGRGGGVTTGPGEHEKRKIIRLIMALFVMLIMHVCSMKCLIFNWRENYGKYMIFVNHERYSNIISRPDINADINSSSRS